MRPSNHASMGLGPILVVGAVVNALVVLNLVLSLVGVAGAWAVILAIGIASVQAVLVVLYSMELVLSRRSVVVVAVITPLFVILMVALTVTEVTTRAPPLLDPPPVDRTLPRPPP